MRHHEHIREEERTKTEAWLGAEWTQEQIAAQLGRPLRTIEKELARNGGAAAYRAGAAQARALANRRKPRRKSKLEFKPLVAMIDRRLKRKWSPEQISGVQARKHAPGSAWYLSFQQLYRTIRARQKAGETGWSSLLRQARRRFRRRGGRSRFERIRNPRGLDQRPAEAEKRTRFGDIESDSLRIRGQVAGLATHVDRTTGFTVLGLLDDRGADAYNRATQEAFARLGLIPQLKSMTVDHGMEFAAHAQLELALGGHPGVFRTAPPALDTRHQRKHQRPVARLLSQDRPLRHAHEKTSRRGRARTQYSRTKTIRIPSSDRHGAARSFAARFTRRTAH